MTIKRLNTISDPKKEDYKNAMVKGSEAAKELNELNSDEHIEKEWGSKEERDKFGEMVKEMSKFGVRDENGKLCGDVHTEDVLEEVNTGASSPPAAV